MSNMKRRTFLYSAIIPSIIGGGLLPIPSSAQSSLQKKQIIGISPDKPFRILQITDIHFFGKNAAADDPKTMELIKGLLQKFNPNLLVITGDSWSNDPDGKGIYFCEECAKRYASLGIPWMFVWGNHDLVGDRNKAHDFLEKAENSLYSRGDGNGNYRIELRDEKTKQPLWQFYIMNSEQEGLTARNTAWLANESKSLPKTPGFIFCHIPVIQYDEIWSNGSAIGIKNEKVCFEKDNGSALTEIAKTGMVRAMFVGHDHTNDYSAESSGVKLVYGRASGFGGYGGDKVEKGGTLIEINPAQKTYSFKSVFPDGHTWKQKKEG